MALSDNQLTNLFLFRGVEPGSVRHLTDQCEVRDFPFDEILLTPDDANHSMYVILEGTATIHLGSVDTDPIAWVGKGESIGEMSALDEGVTPSAYVKVEFDMKTLIISHSILMQLINQSHEVARNLLFLLSN